MYQLRYFQVRIMKYPMIIPFALLAAACANSGGNGEAIGLTDTVYRPLHASYLVLGDRAEN